MKKQRLFCHKLITSFHFQGSFSVKREKKKRNSFNSLSLVTRLQSIDRDHQSNQEEKRREKRGERKKNNQNQNQEKIRKKPDTSPHFRLDLTVCAKKKGSMEKYQRQ